MDGSQNVIGNRATIGMLLDKGVDFIETKHALKIVVQRSICIVLALSIRQDLQAVIEARKAKIAAGVDLKKGRPAKIETSVEA